MIGIYYLMGSVRSEISVKLGCDTPAVEDLCGKEYGDFYPPDGTGGDWKPFVMKVLVLSVFDFDDKQPFPFLLKLSLNGLFGTLIDLG